jgi:putative SOS response-associated peptidase YedK
VAEGYSATLLGDCRKNRDPGVTNIRNVNSPHWRRWTGPDSRCPVPFTSFSEFNKAEGRLVRHG